MGHGLYLCEVKGLKFCDYAILKYDEDGWWQYTKQLGYDIEGWIGNDLEIIKIINKID